jgi:diguanylate cyclase (GGDEF)-like protein
LVPKVHDAGERVALGLLDIYQFKHINDRWGHETGDHALRAVAHAVSIHARRQDQVARFGGEEFCMLVSGLDDASLGLYFDGLRRGIEELRVPVRGGELRMTVSIGVCPAQPDDDLHSLLSEADRRLYLAKAGGRNQVVAAG